MGQVSDRAVEKAAAVFDRRKKPLRVGEIAIKAGYSPGYGARVVRATRRMGDTENRAIFALGGTGPSLRIDKMSEEQRTAALAGYKRICLESGVGLNAAIARLN
jgi:hypothetical protein